MTDTPLKVEQRHRDALADLFPTLSKYAADIRAGKHDDKRRLQAFARFEREHLADREREIVERCARVAEEWCAKHHGWNTPARVAGNAIAAAIRTQAPEPALSPSREEMRKALETISNGVVAFNAHPVGVIETWRNLARTALGSCTGGEG